MADTPKKPRRDLRARLGKTIAPNTKGGVVPPPGAGQQPVAPPALGGQDVPAPVAPPAVAPPAGVTPPPNVGGVTPPPGLGGGAGLPGVAPPPFGQPAAPAAPPPSDDPFANVGAAPAQQVVRLEFDDRMVSDVEVGRKNRLRNIFILVVCLAAGIGLGLAGGSMYEQRQLYNVTVRDGQALYRSVQESSGTVETAQRHINTLFDRARGQTEDGSPGSPSVSYESIEALRGLEKPMDFDRVIGRNYNAFQAGTVNDLFVYTMNIKDIWTRIERLAATSLPEARRAELDRTATAVGEAASTRYGMVLQRSEGEVFGSLSFLEVQQDGGSVTILARPTRSGPGREMRVYTGSGEEIGETAEYVVQVDGVSSRGVLAEQTGAFARFVQDVAELKQLIEQTIEVQGRLEQALGQVAALDEV